MINNPTSSVSKDTYKGYTFSIMRMGSYGQDRYFATAESLSVKTDVFATQTEAEECIKQIIDKTYQETFGTSHTAAAKESHAEPSKSKK